LKEKCLGYTLQLLWAPFKARYLHITAGIGKRSEPTYTLHLLLRSLLMQSTYTMQWL